MTQEQCRQLKILSVLLCYPDQALLDHLDYLRDAIEQIKPGIHRETMLRFLEYLQRHSLLELQEAYTTAFDMNPSTTLNIAYHVWGDDPHRSAFLAWLQKIYHEAGYERTTGDLPDHLPLLLEFLSLNPRTDGIGMIRDCFRKLQVLIDRLHTTVPAYAELLRGLGNLSADDAPRRNKGANCKPP